jgi:leader peptidase (prepilin peptidase)/N-methyltransferase
MIYPILIVGIFGAMIGSFLNVCIARLPDEKSIVTPRSSCPHCQKPIRWFDNIPLLSWFFLRGHCRYCKKTISFQYPFIEALTAVLAVLFLKKMGIRWESLCYFFFSASMVVVAMIDLHHRIIPNVISLPGCFIGFILSFFRPEVPPHFSQVLPQMANLTPLNSFLGILIGGGSLFLIAEIYRLIRKREGMGMGDVKLLGMIGAFLGWYHLFIILFISSFFGAIIGVSFIMIKGHDFRYQIPFGTFLAFAAIFQTLYGTETIMIWHNLIFNIAR